MNAPTSMRVLFVDDSSEDVQSLIEELQLAEIQPEYRRVDSDAALREALQDEWDVILCDYMIPGMDWRRTLAVARELAEDTPLIVVSGHRGEEYAVETMREGSCDFIVKDRLSRLVPAVRREVEAAARRRRTNHTQRLLEQELQRARKLEAAGRLAGGLAHNLGNVLMVIMGGIDLALAEHGEGEGAGYLEEAERAVESAAGMIRQLARLGQEPDFRPRPIDPAKLVGDVEALVRPVMPPGIRFDVRCEPGLPGLLLDPAQLEQAMLNLLLNARDAVGKAGTIQLEVSSEREGEQLSIRVSDDGVGIPAELQERIFEPFYSTKGEGGTGLGLSSAYHAARAHSGRIQVDSFTGRGSVFDLLIPIRVADLPDSGAQAPEAGQRPQAEGRILVVDDAEESLLRIRSVLTRCGYEVDTRGGFKQAIDLLEGDGPRPELIIAEAAMREGGARDLLFWLEARGLLIPMIVVSGFEVERLKSRSLYDRFAGFLSKPLDESVLTELTAETLEAARSRGR